MIQTRLGTPVNIIGGEEYENGKWAKCLYQDNSVCPIHLSDLQATGGNSELEMEFHAAIVQRKLDTWVLEDQQPKRWDGNVTERTIQQITGCNWVYMGNAQYPKLTERIVIDKLPRRNTDKWWLHIGDFTPEQATSVINAQWDLCDEGFVFDGCGRLYWKWW